MEHITYKLSVLLAVLIGSIYRVIRIKSKEETVIGKAIDYASTFIISIIFALVLLNPIMSIFGIPVAAEALVAMMLALSAEAIMRKLLGGIETFNFVAAIESYIIKKYGVRIDIDGKDKNESEDK